MIEFKTFQSQLNIFLKSISPMLDRCEDNSLWNDWLAKRAELQSAPCSGHRNKLSNRTSSNEGASCVIQSLPPPSPSKQSTRVQATITIAVAAVSGCVAVVAAVLTHADLHKQRRKNVCVRVCNQTEPNIGSPIECNESNREKKAI